jgi:hypothetical protein
MHESHALLEGICGRVGDSHAGACTCIAMPRLKSICAKWIIHMQGRLNLCLHQGISHNTLHFLHTAYSVGHSDSNMLFH